MEKLTKAEEEIMQYVWELKECLVSDIIAAIPGKKPPHSTISSIVRILEKKGFVDHKAYGRTHLYFPIVSKSQYSKSTVASLIKRYFKGSPKELVSFLVKENQLSKSELEVLVNKLNDFENSGK